MVRTVIEYVDSEDHLPCFLKDFHDQKDFFKTMHDFYRSNAIPNWVDGHVYIIDFFLRFLAIHGWTLQRSRANVDFCDVHQTTSEYREKIAESFKKFLEQRSKENQRPNENSNENSNENAV